MRRLLWILAGLLGIGLCLAQPVLAAQTVVSLTFDDGYDDAPLAAQLMEQHGFRGTFYIISGVLGEAPYMTVAQVKALQTAGHEIGAHTVSHPDLTTLTLDQARHEICDSRTQLQALGLSPVTNFAYPFGASTAAIEEIVRSCFDSGRGAWELGCAYDGCSPAESLPPVDAAWIRTPDAVVYTTTLNQLKQQVTRAENAGGGWVPMQFHKVCDGCDGKTSDAYTVSPANLSAFLTWLEARASSGTVVKTVGQVMSSLPVIPPPPVSYTLWGSSAPALGDGYKDPSPIEVGVRFKSDTGGLITGLRFYKWTSNTGPHTASLWTAAGTRLTQATFSSESASGWQTVLFSSPVAISSNTPYVASYFTITGYAVTLNYFTQAHDNAPLHAPQSVAGALNGLYLYSSSSTFPTDSTGSSNYWVDVMLSTGSGVVTPPVTNPMPVLSAISPSSATAGGTAFTLTATGSNFISSSTIRWNGTALATTFVSSTSLKASIAASRIVSSGTVNVTVFTSTPGGGTSLSQPFTIASPSVANPIPVLTTLSPSSATAGGAAFTLTLAGSGFISSSTVRWNGTALSTTFVSSATLRAAVPATRILSSGTASVTVFNPAPGGGTSTVKTFTIQSATTTIPGPVTIWGTTAPPAGDGWKDPSPLEIGVRFRSDVAGTITGIRFYKWSTNTGTHTGHLWSNSGTLLASGTFTGETASGWQTMTFATPVAIAANTTYVASYFTTTGYAVSVNYFTVPVNNPPLHALQSGVDGLNGLYLYTAAPAFPTGSTKTSNYWVDVVFTTSAGQAGALSGLQPPTVGSYPQFEDFSQVRVFPNPWRADRSTLNHVTFDQLPSNSTIGLYTLSAHWVKTLDAPSGSALWDLTTDSGDKAASGYYIYLITSPAGKTRGTLAIIR